MGLLEKKKKEHNRRKLHKADRRNILNTSHDDTTSLLQIFL